MKVERPNQRRPDGNIQSMMKDENWYELVVGDSSRSGGQWDIWEATYSPVGADGYPKRLWDKKTGVIDKTVAEAWKKHYDLRHILETNWTTLGPKVAHKINVYIGDMDSYYLNMGVRMLDEFLKQARQGSAVHRRDRLPADGAALLGSARRGAVPEDGRTHRQARASRRRFKELEAVVRLHRCLLLIALSAIAPLSAQDNLFQPALLERADVKALQSVDERATASSTSGSGWSRSRRRPEKEQARAAYIRAEMEKLGLSRHPHGRDVERQRRAQGHGRRADGRVLRAHGHRVSRGHRPQGQARRRHPARARRRRRHLEPDGDARDVPRAQPRRRSDERRSVSWRSAGGARAARREALAREQRLQARHVHRRGRPSNEVWYGALRITQFKFFYTSPGAHTMESRGGPSPARAVAKAIEALYAIPLPPVADGLGTFKLPVLNVGMLGGGTVMNAVPREAWFTVDLRSLDTATQERLEARWSTTAPATAEQEGVGFRMEKNIVDGLLEGAAEGGAAQSPARADGARDREPFPKARHARRSFPPTSDRPTPTSPSAWAFPPSRSARSSSSSRIGSRKPPRPAASSLASSR